MSDSQNRNEGEQQFTIQPHPQTNHSNAVEPDQPASAVQGALSGNPGPAIIDGQTASKLEAPKSKEELLQASSKLNDDNSSA